MDYTVRPVEERDANSVVDIYNYYIKHDFSAYFDEPLSPAFFDVLQEAVQTYPFLVAEKKEVIAGFAFLRRYHPAPALLRTAEICYFIDHRHTQRGIGKQMLQELVLKASQFGITNILASISSLNPGSMAFHEKNGFSECGRIRDAGKKFDRVFDIVYMQRLL